jgi:hypothetical protein
MAELLDHHLAGVSDGICPRDAAESIAGFITPNRSQPSR